MPRLIFPMICLLMVLAATARADEVRVAWLGAPPTGDRAPTVLDGPSPRDLGLAGLRLAMADNNAGGRFSGQSFRLVEMEAGPDVLGRLGREGVRFVVADLPSADLLVLADRARGSGLVLINAGAQDDSLREGECRTGLLHTMPSRAMQADALAQVLVRRDWRKWGLLVGPAPADQLRAAAIRRAARKFGARIVHEKPWTFTRDPQRNAEGEVAAITRDWSYDVLMVADESDEFGDTAVFNTFQPRPVAGTQGLVASAWHPAHDQWGATQAQHRFRAQAGRPMAEKDFAAWVAGRAIGEAVLRARSADARRIEAALRDPAFALPVYKGRAAGFRPWDGQLRQPMLVGWARAVVAVSPQEGFLHPLTDLDTLGTDKGENACAPR